MNLSSIPFELLVGWRYTRAGRAARRNRFISFISSVSMVGIALGVATQKCVEAPIHQVLWDKFYRVRWV